MQKEQDRHAVTALRRMVYTSARRLRVATVQQVVRTAMQASGPGVWPVIIGLN